VLIAVQPLQSIRADYSQQYWTGRTRYSKQLCTYPLQDTVQQTAVHLPTAGHSNRQQTLRSTITDLYHAIQQSLTVSSMTAVNSNGMTSCHIAVSMVWHLECSQQQWRTQEFCSGGVQQIQFRTEGRKKRNCVQFYDVLKWVLNFTMWLNICCSVKSIIYRKRLK
jgi:hypothetical protein